ncbi:transcriptional regulator [Labrys wisconsinensis]|uniref:transcriptional regulator n=1 Tax=Labrys wisconsinensis TaxID=425677 RepID=UPI0027D89CAA|nr:Cro/CI family transcriptional regulator [Labrys wisconsinensis]
MSPVERAISVVGGASAAGRALGITPQAVGQWRRIPAERVLTLEKISGIPRHELRPDLYPPPAVNAEVGAAAGSACDASDPAALSSLEAAE